jgi:probable addiction module antidote protein
LVRPRDRFFLPCFFAACRETLPASVRNAAVAGDGPDATGTFLAALRLVAKAQSLPMADLARDAELGRQALYRSLSQQGNPELDTLTRVLRELGLRLAVESAA